MFYRKHKRVALEFKQPSRAKQQFRDECDINAIMAKYKKTGLVEHVNRYQGQYGDFSTVADYQEALNMVMEAQQAFMSLPAHVRTRFDNDPGQYLEFVQDPGNQEEMVKMGLAHKRPEKPQEEIKGPPGPGGRSAERVAPAASKTPQEAPSRADGG